MKLFLYNNDFDIDGESAVLHGYRLGVDKYNRNPELIKSKDDAVYGTIIEVDEYGLDMFDVYHCIGLEVYERIDIKVTLKDGSKIEAYTYLYQMEKV